jgi:hypothetical protein
MFFTMLLTRLVTNRFTLHFTHDMLQTVLAWNDEIESNQKTHCAVIDVQQW